MRVRFLIASAWLAGSLALSAGTLQQADGIRRSYEADLQAWVLKLRVAQDAAERTRLAAERPDMAAAAKRMWAAIQPNLADPWVVEPAAWLLRLTAGKFEVQPDGNVVPLLPQAAPAIRAAVERHHLNNPGLAPMCMALVASPDQGTLVMLEKISTTHPDKKVQGVASLGVAMMLKGVSDEPEVMRRRLTELKKAIIESSDIEINGTTIAKMAEDELYIIRYLSKGRQAPDLEGVGSGGQPLKLSTFAGKTVVLLFWHSDDGGVEQLTEMVKGMRKRFAGKPFEVVGVNTDSRAVLRSMQEDGTVDWPNFSDPESKLTREYRVGISPLAYVLDGERKIHYVGGMGSFVELTAGAVMDDK